MARRWKWLVAGVVVVLALCAGAAAGAYAYLQFRSNRHLGLAQAAYEKQDWSAAKQHYAWYLTRHKGDADALRKYADAASRIADHRNGQLNDIGRALLQLAIQHPEENQYRLDALDFYHQHRNWKNLEYYATTFLRDKPDDDTFMYYKAFAIEKMGRRKDALDAYTALIDRKTNRPEVYGTLAVLTYQEGFTEQAGEYLTQAAERFKDDPRVAVQRARFMLESRNLDKAREEITAALRQLPDDAEALSLAGQIAMQAKDYAGAAGYFEKSMQINPKVTETFLHLAWVYERSGDQPKAIALLQQMDPMLRLDNPEVYFALAEMQFAINAPDDADKTIAEYQKAYPEHEVVFSYFDARKLLSAGSAKEAAEKLGSVVKQKPDFVRAQYYQALAYLQCKDLDHAKSTLEAYLRAHPDDEVAQDVWNQSFGRPRTVAAAKDEAERSLSAADKPAAELVMAANDMVRLQPVGDSENKELVVRLLKTAIERDPKLLDPYLALADYLVKDGKPQDALKTLADAEAAGVAADLLAYPRASIALGQRNVADAQSMLAQATAKQPLQRADAKKWAQLFADQGYLAEGLKVLADAAAANENERLEIEMDRVSLCARSGDGKQALALMDELAPRVAQDPQAMRRLVEQKIDLVRALLDTPNSDVAQAGALLADAERSMPDAPAVKVLKTRLNMLGDAPDLDQAETVGESILETDAANVDALLLLNEVAEKKGQHGAAAGYAQRAAAAAPQERRVQLATAESLRLSGLLPAAKRWLESALVTRPNDVRALTLLFRVCGDGGEVAQARDVLNRITALDASEAARKQQARLDGALALYEKRYAEAEDILRRYIAEDPADEDALDDLTAVFVQQGRNADAEKFLKEHATQNNADVNAWCRLGRFYLSEEPENLPEASSSFTRAIYVDPDYSPALRGMMEVQLRMKNPGGALSLCERYLSIQPNDADVLWQKAELMMPDAKRQNEALDAINKAIALVEKPKFFTCRGLILIGAEKYQEALADLQRAADAQAVRPARLDAALALAYVETNEIELARQYAASAAEKPEDPAANALLARVKRRLEEMDKNGTAPAGS